jgi:hypothetical protein
MVATVGGDMQKDLFARHSPFVPVGEGEIKDLRALSLRERRDVLFVPGICGCDITPKLSQRWRLLCARRVEWPRLARQMSPKDPVHDVDVIEDTDTEVQSLRVLLRQGRQNCEQLFVGPSLVAEEGSKGGGLHGESVCDA